MSISTMPWERTTMMGPRGPIHFRGREEYIKPIMDESLVGSYARDWARDLFGKEPQIPKHMSPETFAQMQQYRRSLQQFRKERLLRTLSPRTWWGWLKDPAHVRKAETDKLMEFWAENPMLQSPMAQRAFKDPKQLSAAYRALKTPEQKEMFKPYIESGAYERTRAHQALQRSAKKKPGLPASFKGQLRPTKEKPTLDKESHYLKQAVVDRLLNHP